MVTVLLSVNTPDRCVGESSLKTVEIMFAAIKANAAIWSDTVNTEIHSLQTKKTSGVKLRSI